MGRTLPQTCKSQLECWKASLHSNFKLQLENFPSRGAIRKMSKILTVLKCAYLCLVEFLSTVKSGQAVLDSTWHKPTLLGISQVFL
jgi:hypothetical protein